MRLLGYFLAIVLTSARLFAQAKSALPPVAFDALLEVLKSGDVVFPMTAVIEGIQNRGIAFDLGNPQLEAILSAAAEGKRRPGDVAALISAGTDACQKCRARFLAPLSLDELLTMLKRGQDASMLLQEVKARRVKDLDISEATAFALSSAGANQELVAFLVPDDKVKISPLIGYTTLELKRAEDYDPSAPAGWIKVTAAIPANSTDEFVFKHNALFGRAVTGGESTNLTAYFNKPAPRNTRIEFIAFDVNLESGESNGGDEKRSGGFLGFVKGKPKDDKAKDVSPIEVAYPAADSTGRNSFQIRLTNKLTSSQQYSFTVRWRVLATAKPTAAPAKPAPTLKK